MRFSGKTNDFARPTQLPSSAIQRQAWQNANAVWWEQSPMRYDWREKISAEPGSREYFFEIDRRFLESARRYLPWSDAPFDALIPYRQLRDKDVLEVGVGHGTHAQLLAPFCKSFTGIDLTDLAVTMTAKRLELAGLSGTIQRMDAEKMNFPDQSFDYVWSWGVIHHSADTRLVLQEIHRVLRNGGHCTVMVYYRSWWHYYACGSIRRIFGYGESLHDAVQSSTDGALARYYSFEDWRKVTAGLFAIDALYALGQKSELFPIPSGRVKDALEHVVPDSVSRVLTNKLRMGSFLIAQMRKT